jgi:hypothetical protein
MQEAALTDNWIVANKAGCGVRIIKGDRTFGAVARVQTLGFDESDNLIGVDQRR